MNDLPRQRVWVVQRVSRPRIRVRKSGTGVRLHTRNMTEPIRIRFQRTNGGFMVVDCRPRMLTGFGGAVECVAGARDDLIAGDKAGIGDKKEQKLGKNLQTLCK